jgi:hypothetical protein
LLAANVSAIGQIGSDFNGKRWVFIDITYTILLERGSHSFLSDKLLDRAYLSLFKTEPSTRTEIEFLCLHCDPNEPDDARHAIYKKGPHLHIQVAEEPIPHAHIALNRGHLDAVLNSPDSLTKAMGAAILMLREEILDAVQ